MQRKCEICQIEHATIITKVSGYDGSEKQIKVRIVRDHNHETGYIRGALCDNCNISLGMYEFRARQKEEGKKVKKLKKKYRDWRVEYQSAIDVYLAKPSSNILYVDYWKINEDNKQGCRGI